MLRLVDLVILAELGDFEAESLKVRGDVEVDGVLDGVGVLSDSSESFKSCDLPRHILRTMGGLESSRFALFAFEVSTVFSLVLFFEEKNFFGDVVLLVLAPPLVPFLFS